MTAWAAKFCSNAICLSVNGLTSMRRIKIAPTGFPCHNNGAASVLATARSAFRALARQGHPHGTSIDQGSPGHRHSKHNTAGSVGEAIYGVPQMETGPV